MPGFGKRDVGRIDRLIQVFYEKALAGDVQSGLLTVRIWERLHELLGLDAVQRIDLQIVQTPQAETRHDKIRRVFWELRHPGQPMPDGWPSSADDDDAPHPKQLNGGGGQPAARRELGGERSLEQLKAGSSNGQADDSVDDPDDDDDPDPGPLDSLSKRGIVG